MRVVNLITALFLLVVLLVTNNALAADTKANWLTAEGSGAILKGNSAQALIDATHAAMRSAVEREIGVMLASETVVENTALIEDKIMTRVSGYVKKHELIEKSCKDDICTVKIKAQVERTALADDVAALAHILPLMNYPAVVVSFSQKALSQNLQSVPLDLSTVEQTVTKSLAAKGFRIINASARQKEQLRQATLQEQTGNMTGKALELIAPISQVVISGQVLLQDNGGSPYNDKIRSYSAVISAQAYETVTGKLLTTATADGVAPHHSFAIGTQNAALKAADKLANTISIGITKGWLDACYNEHEIMLIVENLPFDKIDAFKSAVTTNIPGILKINQRSFVKGRAEFGVGWKSCNTERLAKELNGIKMGKETIKVTENTGNSIRVKIDSKK